MKYCVITIFILIVLFVAGCQPQTGTKIKIGFEVWEYRDGKPRRLDSNDPMMPAFRDMRFPSNVPETTAEKTVEKKKQAPEQKR